MAEGRTLGDPETVHYGLLPRTNRGIFGLNELPDLAERIQVAMFNVLEERDIQVRGYSLRLPLDLLLVASANPEDYTNRGRIITPLKDRFGAEIRTHYPREVADEVALIAQEADLVAEVPEHLLEVVARFDPRAARVAGRRPALRRVAPGSRSPRPRASPPRRCAAARSAGEEHAVARVCDLPAVVPTLLRQGRVRDGRGGPRGRGRSTTCCGVAVAETFRDRLAGLDLSGFTDLFAEGGDRRDRRAGAGRRAARASSARVPGLSKVLDRLGHGDDASPGEVAAAVEFVLEGLHLTRRIDKDTRRPDRVRSTAA